MEIQKYRAEHKAVWNDFVEQSKNGTFLFFRDFMEYHADRFTDHSLLFFDKGKLLSVFPANIHNTILYSHQGLTYGGLLLSSYIKTSDVLAIMDSLIYYSKSIGVKEIVYKTVPHIYHKYPSEEDLYALFRSDARLTSRSISSTVFMGNRLDYAQLRKRQVKKAKSINLELSQDENFDEFWAILRKNLNDRYNVDPVHSLQEIFKLKSLFPDNIHLFCAKKDGQPIAGCLVFETHQMAHIQYISANEEGKEIGALDFIFDKLINEVYADKTYFDFGISTEQEGNFLNEGLISQKEGFGARATVYDVYTINL